MKCQQNQTVKSHGQGLQSECEGVRLDAMEMGWEELSGNGMGKWVGWGWSGIAGAWTVGLTLASGRDLKSSFILAYN